MTDARIYQRGKSSTQSGRAKADGWVLEYEPKTAKRADPLMGWAGSGNTMEQLQLSFPTLEAAQDYAKANGLTYSVVAAAGRTLKLQSYADNFTGSPINVD